MVTENFKELPELIGATPIEVIRQIVEMNPDIVELYFWQYTYIPLKYEVPEINPIPISREDFLQGNRLNELIESLPEGYQLGIFSQILMKSGEVMHIPMMDYSLSKSPESLKLLIERLEDKCITKGWILETGESYHYYGCVLSTEEHWWCEFLGRSLLTSNVEGRDNIQQVADPRYIGYALLRKGCVLRITTFADKDFVPKVVARI